MWGKRFFKQNAVHCRPRGKAPFGGMLGHIVILSCFVPDDLFSDIQII